MCGVSQGGGAHGTKSWGTMSGKRGRTSEGGDDGGKKKKQKGGSGDSTAGGGSGSDLSMDLVKTILAKITKNRDAQTFFMQPVDWKALGLPDYPEVVKNPMDIGTVKEKLKANPSPPPKIPCQQLNYAPPAPS
jgi:hypothetical protein